MPRGIRSKNWNYGGGNWRLSRSKIDLFIECHRCFYLDNKLGIRRPSLPGFLINTAVDTLLKKEFDLHRVGQTPHLLFDKFGIQAVPFQHPKIDTWRENFEGVEHTDPDTDLVVSGAIDDLWQLDTGQVVVVDYKSTAKEELDMSSKWIQNYYRQLEVYQWLLRHNNLNVADTAYILYANGDIGAEAFDGKVNFKMSLHKHIGNTDWIPATLQDIKETLESAEIPDAGDDCEHCEYCELRQSKILPTQDSTPKVKTLFD